jgi:hypothetical protein
LTASPFTPNYFGGILYNTRLWELYHDDPTLRRYPHTGEREQRVADVQVPAGTWRVVSLIALAMVAGNVETTDVETVVALNQVERLRASESGSLQAFVVGGAPMRTTATKKIALADVLVRVIIKLEQS